MYNRVCAKHYFRTAMSAVLGMVIFAAAAAGQTTTLRLKANTHIFAPGDPVEFNYTVKPDFPGQVWVGLMKATEPHRAIFFDEPSDNINRFQPISLEMLANGVFSYTAPNTGGNYEVRAFNKVTGDELATVGFRVEADFLAELRAWRKELDTAVATNLAPRYGDNNIKGTYAAAFAAAGSTDPKYVDAWSMWFWLHNVTKSPGNAGTVFYHRPIERIADSYRNIDIYRAAYSNEDVQHYREGMRRWRATHMKIYPLFEQMIRLEAEANRDILETYERLKSMHGPARDAEEKAAAKRSEARKQQMTPVIDQLKELKAQPIFAFTVGEAKKPS